MTKKTVKIISNLLFLVLFAGLLWHFSSPQQALETLNRISPLYFVTGLLCLIASYVLRTHRFYQLFAEQNLAWWGVMKIMLQHNAINNLLPLRLGELSFPILVKQQQQIPYRSSAKVLITARLFDVGIMATLAFVVLSLLLLRHSPMLLVAMLVGIGLMATILGLLTKAGVLPFAQQVLPYLHYCQAHVRGAGLTSLAIWSVKLLGQALWLAPMLGTPWLYSLFAVLIVEGTAILPVNGPLNFGSLEGAAMLALTPLGLAPSLVLAAILNLHIAIIMLAALGYLVSVFLPSPATHEVSS